MTKVKVDGKTLHARPCTADEWFDLQEKHEKERDFNKAIMALCIFDEKGNRPYTSETVGKLSLPDWQVLEKLVTRANRPEDPEKN